MESWLEEIEKKAAADYAPFINAITKHGGVKLQLSGKAIDVLAERAASKKPVKCSPSSATIERRKHVRDKEGRILFLRVLEIEPDGPVALVDYSGWALAKYTMDASGLDVQDGWYEPGGGGGGGGGGGLQRRVAEEDEGGGTPVAELPPPRGPGRI
jgi:hypothetical protein